MVIRKRTAFWALFFALAMTLSAFGQGRRNGQQQQQQQAAPAPQGIGLVTPTKDESDAFNSLQKEQARVLVPTSSLIVSSTQVACPGSTRPSAQP